MKLSRITSLTFTLTCALVSLSASARGSTLFLGAYPDQVLVFDDVKGQMETRIKLITGLPTSLSISMDRKTIYATTNDHDGIEVIDVATRKVTSHFVLDTPTTKYRLNGVTPDPTGKFLYCITTEIDKLADHYEVGRPKIHRDRRGRPEDRQDRRHRERGSGRATPDFSGVLALRSPPTASISISFARRWRSWTQPR